MGIFDKLLQRKPANSPQDAAEQAVLLYLEGEDFDRMITLSDKLTDAIESSGVGLFDGNEIGGGETTLFMYGPDAEAIFKAIEPILRNDTYAQGAKALIRQGPPGAPQREITIGKEELL